jgi:hypothetical protein
VHGCKSASQVQASGFSRPQVRSSRPLTASFCWRRRATATNTAATMGELRPSFAHTVVLQPVLHSAVHIPPSHMLSGRGALCVALTMWHGQQKLAGASQMSCISRGVHSTTIQCDVQQTSRWLQE